MSEHAITYSRGKAEDDFQFVVRYRTAAVDDGASWLDYSVHPASKLGLHNALLARHDRIEILAARGESFECSVFVVRKGVAEPLSQQGAERLFATLPHGNVKWTDLCRCLLPPLGVPSRRSTDRPPGGTSAGSAAESAESPVFEVVVRRSADADQAGSAEQLPLFPHTHTLYDDVDEHPTQHKLDVAA